MKKLNFSYGNDSDNSERVKELEAKVSPFDTPKGDNVLLKCMLG